MVLIEQSSVNESKAIKQIFLYLAFKFRRYTRNKNVKKHEKSPNSVYT